MKRLLALLLALLLLFPICAWGEEAEDDDDWDGWDDWDWRAVGEDNGYFDFVTLSGGLALKWRNAATS